MRRDSVMRSAFARFAARPAVAERRPLPVTNEQLRSMDHGLLDAYEVLTHGELGRRVESVAQQLAAPAATSGRVGRGDRVALLGHAGVDFTTADLACNLAGVTTVPLQTSGTVEQQRAILDETTPRVLAVSVSLAARAAELVAGRPGLERVVLLDYRGGESEHRRARDELARRTSIEPELLDLDIEGVLPDAEPRDPDGLAMLLYTSGSTGTPKGAMYTDRLVDAMWGGAGWSEFFAEESGIVSFHYMPMSHVAGHSSVRSTLARGGATYFASTANLSGFFDDLRLARPTELSLVPRVCELLRQEYERRLHAVTATDGDENGARRVLDEMRDGLLGGRVGWASCTSAPVSAELKRFVESLLGIEVHELYGTTEVGGVLADGRFLSPPVLDYRLEDVPELGYLTSDRPDARGELLIRSTSTIPGYFNRPELDREVFADGGYYRTGDIAAVDGAGRVRIIDRKNAIIKLAQGEFVALPSLEARYVAGSADIHQVFLHGRSDQSALLAVVVPSRQALRELGDDASALRARLLQEMRRVAAQDGLNSYEVPGAVLLEVEPFSEENGLLSDHRKAVRPRLLERYGARLDAMYDQRDAGREDLLARLLAEGTDGETIDTVRRAVSVALQIDVEDVPGTARFRDLGGDSLTAVHLARLLTQVYDVRVTVDAVASESSTLQGLATHIDARRTTNRDTVPFEQIHRGDPRRLRAADLTIPRFVDGSPEPAPGTTGGARTILVTGASGYLGRFLCLDLLREVAGTGHRVVCLVRASDDATARDRLRRTFATSSALLAEFDALAGNLDVLAGDLAEARLGLDDPTWDRLARDVTEIVHAGAMVNHALPYRELFAANVAGTAEIVRLAVEGPVKPVTFMSSIAAALLRGTSTPVDEFADVRDVLPEVEATDGIVDGYAATKWAGEVLLRDAHERYGLPVTVFRASMILAHTRHRGQINVPDTFTRLVFSMARTGLAPTSFYRRDGARAHYDGLPVDTVARIVTTLTGGTPRDRFATYHLVNPFDDGVSLDTVVAWLVDAGVPLTRLAPYDRWLSAFESSLSGLDEADKRASVLPLLEALRVPEEPASGSLITSTRLTQDLAASGSLDLLASLTAPFAGKVVEDLEHVFDRRLRTSSA